MAEDSTRKLLRIFGVAVTDFEDRCQEIARQARDAGNRGGDPAAYVPMLEALAQSTSEVMTRLLEVTRLVVEQQNRTFGEVSSLLEEAKRRTGSSA